MSDLSSSSGITRHRFFKGCTRPAMFMGIPLLPFLLTTGIFLVLAVWLYYFFTPYVSLLLIVIYIPIIMVMRQMTKKDDQRLRQLILRLRMRVAQSNKNQWGAISFSPISYKKRK